MLQLIDGANYLKLGSADISMLFKVLAPSIGYSTTQR